MGPQSAGGLDAVAHRHRHPGGKVGHLLGGQPGAEKGGQVKPLAPGGLEGAAPAAPAPGLLLRQHHQALGGPGHGPALALGAGGVNDLQAHQLPAYEGAGQRGGQLPRPEEIRARLQPVAPVGGGGDHIALLPQGLDHLPDPRPADAQDLAHGLPGQIFPLPLPQEGQHFFPAHTDAPSDYFLYYTAERRGRQPAGNGVDGKLSLHRREMGI